MMAVVSRATRELLKETIIDELQVLPELLRKAERKYYEAQHELAELQGRKVTAGGELKLAEERTIQWRTEVDFLLRRLESYHAMARLLSGK